jgi:hypothetical protein
MLTRHGIKAWWDFEPTIGAMLKANLAFIAGNQYWCRLYAATTPGGVDMQVIKNNTGSSLVAPRESRVKAVGSLGRRQ